MLAVSTRSILSCAILLVLACGHDQRPRGKPTDDIAPVDLNGAETVEGSRLQRLVWKSDEGPTVPTDMFYDRIRGERCRFLLADDGELRCLPADLVSPFEYSNGDVQLTFADPQCTETALPPFWQYRTFPDKPAPRYGTPERLGACGGHSVYELGDVVENPYSGEDCTPFYYEYEVRALGAYVPSSEFVRAQTSHHGSTPLEAHQLTAEDGTAILLGFWDTTLGEPCRVEWVEGGRNACIPTSAVKQTWFSYPSWEEALSLDCPNFVYIAPYHCGTLKWGLSDHRNQTSVHPLVSWPSESSFGEETTDCAERAVDMDVGSVFVLGPKLPASSFHELNKFLRSGSAIQSRYVKDEVSGISLSTPVSEGLVDRESDEDCWLEVAGDGKVRCLPAGYHFARSEFFSDPECQKPVINSERYENIRKDDNPFFLGSEPLLRTTTMDGRTRIYELGEPYEGPAYVFYEENLLETSRRCQSRRDATAEGGWRAAGPELPPERFAEYVMLTLEQ